MKNDESRQFAIALLHADPEDDVIAILKGAGYRHNLAARRLYGDKDNNYDTIGNQQSRPDAALSEKVVNCIDARLLGETLRRGIDPTSAAAPASMRQALSLFFEGRELSSDRGGMMQDWDQAKQLEESQHI